MKLSDLRPNPGATKRKKRVGRGPSSGHGKTATRGHKGQKSRSGGLKNPAKHEGGRSTLLMRLPKRGMRGQVPGAIPRTVYEVVNLKDLARKFPEGGEVTPEALQAAGLVHKNRPVKLLATGEVTVAYNVRVHAASQQAVKKIEAAGGKVDLIAKGA